ncbi:hypothetical protein OHS70_05520 [Streptomyces sp. NBC_00390]|uniref:hypothetical protein n=1 Tax=Streptomyces sp. NBC_00390 TaxID=2975736 RepID=UPI002E1D34DA
MTSSLTISSVVKSISSSPHWASWDATSVRARAVEVASTGSSHVVTFSAARTRVRATSRATSSATSPLGRWCSNASSTALHVSSDERAGTANAP